MWAWKIIAHLRLARCAPWGQPGWGAVSLLILVVGFNLWCAPPPPPHGCPPAHHQATLVEWAGGCLPQPLLRLWRMSWHLPQELGWVHHPWVHKGLPCAHQPLVSQACANCREARQLHPKGQHTYTQYMSILTRCQGAKPCAHPLGTLALVAASSPVEVPNPCSCPSCTPSMPHQIGSCKALALPGNTERI